MRGQALGVAGAVLAAALTTAQPAAAQQYPTYHDAHVSQQQYCSQRRNGNTAAGAGLGAIAGAVLGSQAAARGHRTDGSVLGAVLGGVAGAMIARSNSRCEATPQGSYDPYYGQSQQTYPPQQGSYYGNDPYRDDEDLYGGPQPSSYGRANDRNCRWGEMTTRDPDGYEMRENVYMCRGRDGVWRPRDR